MAVNETIVTGRKFRKLIDAANKQWQRISFWHKASDCEFDDGDTAETKVGAIKGITTDLNTTTTGYAADMTTVASLNSSLGTVVSNIYVGSDGKLHKVIGGADTALNFNSIISSDSAPSSFTASYGISNTTGWIGKGGSSVSGTWKSSKNTDATYVYKNLALYKLTSITISYNSSASTQGGGSASCGGTLYLYGVNGSSSLIQKWAKGVGNSSSGSYTYTVTNDDYKTYQYYQIKGVIDYSASPGGLDYSQSQASYWCTATATYQKL